MKKEGKGGRVFRYSHEEELSLFGFLGPETSRYSVEKLTVTFEPDSVVVERVVSSFLKYTDLRFAEGYEFIGDVWNNQKKEGKW